MNSMLDVIQECMKMTSFGGEAKSQALMAIRQAREGNFESAAESMKIAEEALLHSHKAHTALLSADATTGDIGSQCFNGSCCRPFKRRRDRVCPRPRNNTSL